MPELDRDALKQYVSSKGDERTVNNVMRHEYRVLSDAEKAQMQAIKDEGLKFYELVKGIGQSRELSLALTKIEMALS
jgi:phosphoribosylaminoimidazole-succinocarboxamide synthase